MAEPFDSQLADLHRREQEAADQDYQNRLKQAESDYRDYEAFAEWVNARGGEVVAKIDRNCAEAYMQAVTCEFWIWNGEIGSSYRQAAEPWQILWDMWEAQLRRDAK